MAEQTLKEKTAKGLFWGGLSKGTTGVELGVWSYVGPYSGCIRLRNGWNVGNL